MSLKKIVNYINRNKTTRYRNVENILEQSLKEMQQTRNGEMTNKKWDDFEKELNSEKIDFMRVPKIFWFIWIIGALVSLSITGGAIYVGYKVLHHFGIL